MLAGKKMKIKMTNFGAVFNLHCPRCGNTDWSEQVYDSGKNVYHKCLHCGADVYNDEHSKIGIVIENPFLEFTPNTYDDIYGIDGLDNNQWKLTNPETCGD
jgi:predicted nucleic-acid-binding Zn-ribbon protein